MTELTITALAFWSSTSKVVETKNKIHKGTNMFEKIKSLYYGFSLPITVREAFAEFLGTYVLVVSNLPKLIANLIYKRFW